MVLDPMTGRHLQRHQMPRVEFECVTCHERFPSRAALREHNRAAAKKHQFIEAKAMAESLQADFAEE